MTGSKHNIKRGEIRKIGKELSRKLKPLGVEPEEIVFFGSRVKGKAREDSDLDVAVIPKRKIWDSPREYTQLMENVKTHTKDVKYRGNPLDLQVVNTFAPAEAGFCFEKLKRGKITRKCEL